MKFLLNRGHTIPSPAAAEPQPRAPGRRARGARGRHRGAGGALQGGRVQRGHRPPLPRRSAAAGRPGLVLVGKAQERTSSWRGYVDDTHAGHRPSHPHIAWRRQSSVPDHWYFYFADAEWGPAFLKAVHLRALPAVVLRQRPRVGQTPAGQGRDRLRGARQRAAHASRTPPPPTASAPASAPVTCADLLARMMAVIPDPLCADDRRAGFEWSFSIAQLEVSDTAVFDQPRRARAWFEAAIGDHLDLGRPERVSLVVDRKVRQPGPEQDPGTLRHRGHHPRHRPPAPDPLQVLQGQGLPERRPGPPGRDDGEQRQRLRPPQDPQRRELEGPAPRRGRHQRPLLGRPRRGTARPSRPRHPRIDRAARASTTASAPPACASATPAPWRCSAPSPPSPTSSAD